MALMTTAPVVDPPVQMMTQTYLTFTHWYFVWQMATAIEILIVAFLFFILRPYLPFIISRLWTHLPVVGVMNRVRNIAPFGGFTLRNGMYRREWNNNIMYYVKKYLGSYFFFGVPFDIVHIDRGFVQEPVMNKYVSTLIAMGYNGIQSIDDALTFNNLSEDDEHIGEILEVLGFDSYKSAKASINPSSLEPTSLLYAPKYSNIPNDSLLGFGAEISPGSIAAQVDDIFEYRKPPLEKARLLELLPYAILLITIAVSAAIVISMVK